MKTAALWIWMLLMTAAPAGASPPLSLTTDDGYPLSTEDGTGLHDQVIKEAFARIGMTIAIVHLPSERALMNANEGIDDGNFARIAGLENLYLNLVRVPEPVSSYEFVAFTRHVDVPLREWKDLADYYVGIITGWKILEQNVVGTRGLIKVKDQQQLFTLLEKDRTDIIVYSRYEGYGVIRKRGLKGIRVMEPCLDRRDMYLYLHSKHRSLIPKLAEALKAIKRDGTYAAIFHQTVSPLINEVDSW